MITSLRLDGLGINGALRVGAEIKEDFPCDLD